MMIQRFLPACTVALACVVVVTSTAGAQAALESIDYRGQQVQGYNGAVEGFPDGFLGLLCEGGRTTDDARTGCVQLNADGTGTWENDYGPGRQYPAARMKWWVIADQQGTVTRIDQQGGRQSWVLVFKAEPGSDYPGFAAGTMMRMTASRFPAGGGTRYIIDSKYRDR